MSNKNINKKQIITKIDLIKKGNKDVENIQNDNKINKETNNNGKFTSKNKNTNNSKKC